MTLFAKLFGVLAMFSAALAMCEPAQAQTTNTRIVTNTTTFGNNNNVRIGPAVQLNRFGSSGSLYGNPFAPSPLSPYSGYGYSLAGSSSGGCYGSGYGTGGGSYGSSSAGYGNGSGGYSGAYGSGGGYTGGYSGSCGDPYSGYLTGAAGVISSQASFLVSKRQADVLNEQARSAAVDVRRKIYEQWKYERNDQPTLEQIRREGWEQAYKRAIFNPPLNDIWSADALNRILDHASRIQGRGIDGATVALNDGTIRQINFSTGVAGSIGVLKERGRLRWPTILEREDYGTERELFSHLAVDAVRQGAMNNRVDPGTLHAMQTNLATLNERLTGRVGDLAPEDYMDAKRYLKDLDQALRILKRPDVAKFLNNEYAARGQTAGELIQNMSSLGVRFAPATPGSEAAYNALYKGLVSYDLTLTQKQ
jgi:hypothetical protein